jgi:hypothetical protein
MFEFGRELRKFFGADRLKIAADGLTGGDASLLELLDLNLLQQEGRSADIAAGRVSGKDKAQRRLEAAAVWREIARRTGDPVTLRKAAAAAEVATSGFDSLRHPEAWARARCEQGFCALLGAELFGDDGLNAAAEVAFREARLATRNGLAAPLADVGMAIVEARQALAQGDAVAARAIAQRFEAPIAALETQTRRANGVRPLAAEARLARADILCAWGERLNDADLIDMALADAAAAARRLDCAYEPLTWARAEILRGQALSLRGETVGEVDDIASGATALVAALEHLTRDHSPLDWARTQMALARAMQALGDASADERAYEQAVTCFDRAHHVLKDALAMPLRAVVASARAVCLARSAELTGDLGVLDVAEAAMKIELSTQRASRDPVGWALAQLHLARLYEARMEITGQENGERAAAVLALDAALDVFAEQGLRSLSAIAYDALDRLSVEAPAEPPTKR